MIESSVVDESYVLHSVLSCALQHMHEVET